MKVINFKGFKDVPVCVRILYGIAVLFALAGISTIILDWSGLCEVKLCASIALCTVSAVINNIVLYKYRDKLYKDV